MASEINAEPLQVDVRKLSLEDRRMAIAEALDALRGGRSVVLITDRDPRHTLEAFRQLHRDEVDFTISVLNPDLFHAHMQLRRLERQQSLAEHLRSDHARIDGLLTEVQHYLRVGAWAEAEQHFTTLEQDILRHMSAEEALLFPALQSMTESAARAVPGLLNEHGELRRLLPSLAMALGKQDVVTCEGIVPQLRRSLARHHEDEERLVYPISDWALSPDEQAELTKRLAG